MTKLKRTLEFDPFKPAEAEFTAFLKSNRTMQVLPDVHLNGNKLLKYWIAAGFSRGKASELAETLRPMTSALPAAPPMGINPLIPPVVPS